MFRVESQLEFLVSAGHAQMTDAVTLRGYQTDEPVGAPAEFNAGPSVPVGGVVGFCPSLRDLHLEKVLKVAVPGRKRENQSWPRLAGRIIEKALEYAYREFSVQSSADAASVDELVTAAATSIDAYFSSLDRRKVSGLDAAFLNGRHLESGDLRRRLIDCVALDLFFQHGARRFPNQSEETEETRLLDGLKLFPEWQPADHLKLGKATPDFTLLKHRAIGDVKSGDWSDDYLLTAAGYAIAHESVFKNNIDIGLIYLVDTDPVVLGQGRLVAFLLTDAIRRRFLDRRNDALQALQPASSPPPRLQTKQARDHYCERCAFRSHCFPADLSAFVDEVYGFAGPQNSWHELRSCHGEDP